MSFKKKWKSVLEPGKAQMTI